MSKTAIIDLSSLGVSTIIAEEHDGGTFETVYKDRTDISIIDYFDGRNILPRGVEKLIDALITARSTTKAMGADRCYVISTAAFRNVDNIGEVAEKIRMRTGMVINHLDGKTEAYCDLVSNARYKAYGDALLIDIGGGSVELCDLTADGEKGLTCLEFGPVKLRNKYVADIYPTEAEAKKLKKVLREKFDKDKLPDKSKYGTVVLVGAVNTAIYAVFREYCEKAKLGDTFTYDKFKKFVKTLLTSSDRTRMIMKVAPEKINVVPVATLILKELLRRFKPDSIIISDTGVKEGYLELVSSGKENGVFLDLNSPIPVYEPVPIQKKSAKKSKNK